MSPLKPLIAVRAVDHIGFTVPDLEEAHDFLTQVIGCKYMYRLGPFHSDDGWMKRHLGVPDDAVMNELRFYELGGQAIFEVFHYEAREQRKDIPLNSDIGGHHVALYVDDLDEAVAALRSHGLEVRGDPTSSRGPSLGQRWIYFQAPWGMQFELVSYPAGKAHGRTAETLD